MSEENKNTPKPEKKVLVTKRVITALEELVERGVEKNHRRIADRIGLDYSNTPKYKNGDRNIGTDVIYDAVNELGMDPRYIFLKDGPEMENLLMEGTIYFKESVGDNNTITNEHKANKPVITGNQVFGNLTVVHSLETLINEIPPELHDKIKEHFSLMSGEIAGLKKMLDDSEKRLVEEKQNLVDTKQELVEVKQEMRQKDAQLLQVLQELSTARQKALEVQEKYSLMLQAQVEKKKTTPKKKK